MPTTIPQLSRLMNHLLTTVADRLAVHTGFVQRVSPLTGSIFARTLVFSWWQTPAASCTARATLAATLGCPISPQGFDQRFGARSAAFLQALLGTAVQQAVAADPVTIPVLARFPHVEICDGSVISLPPPLADAWPGCGPAPRAGLKFVLRFDLCTGQLIGPHLAPARCHDQTVAATLPPLPAQSLFIGDLGFFNLPQFAAWSATGRYWLSRYKLGTVVASPAGARLDLVAWLRQYGQGTQEWLIRLGDATALPCRLIAQRVPAAVATQRRAALAADARAAGREVSAEAWELARWTLLVTNVPAARLSAAEALALGQARWQVELVMKRFKSLGQVDEWQTANPQRILTEIYAKLLIMVLQHWLLVLGCWREERRSLWRAVQEIQRWGHTLAWATQAGCGDVVIAAVVRAVARCRSDQRRSDPSTEQRLRTARPPLVNSVAA